MKKPRGVKPRKIRKEIIEYLVDKHFGKSPSRLTSMAMTYKNLMDANREELHNDIVKAIKEKELKGID